MKAKELRKSAGLTQKDCRKITGHTQSSISNYEKAEYPNAEYVAKLCSHLNIRLSEFWKASDETESLPSYIKPEQAEILRLINTNFDTETRIALWDLFHKALEGFAIAGGIKITGKK